MGNVIQNITIPTLVDHEKAKAKYERFLKYYEDEDTARDKFKTWLRSEVQYNAKQQKYSKYAGKAYQQANENLERDLKIQEEDETAKTLKDALKGKEIAPGIENPYKKKKKIK